MQLHVDPKIGLKGANDWVIFPKVVSEVGSHIFAPKQRMFWNRAARYVTYLGS